jgi:hypothetical protein
LDAIFAEIILVVLDKELIVAPYAILINATTAQRN